MNTARRVRFHRARAISWLAIGALVGTAAWMLPQHRTDILLVATTAASFYANFAGDWASAEAADDRPVTKRLDRIEHVVRGGHELDGVVDVSRIPVPYGPAPGARGQRMVRGARIPPPATEPPSPPPPASGARPRGDHP